MPAHNRLRPNDRHRIEHTRYEPVEPYEAKAVEPAEGRALMATPTQQYIQLMTKRYHLCLKRLSRPEEVDDHPLEQIQELEHPEFMARFGPSRQADGICDRDRRLTSRQARGFALRFAPTPFRPNAPLYAERDIAARPLLSLQSRVL